MWKKVLFALIPVLVITLIACSSPAPSPSAAPAPAPAKTSTVAPAPSPAAAKTTTAAAPSQPTKVYQLKFFWSSGAQAQDYVTWDKYYKQEVEKRSQGRIAFKVFMVGEVPYKMEDETKIVRDRLVESSRVSASFVEGTNPILAVLNLPYLIPEKEMWWDALKVTKPYVDAEFAKFNQMSLYPGIMPWQMLWTSKPFTSLQDIKGRKIRIYNPTCADIVKLLGGSPVNLAMPDVAIALERGTIEGLITAPTTIDGFKLADTIRSGALNLFLYSEWTNINLDAWKELPPDLQKIMLDVGEKAAKDTWDEMWRYDTEVRKTLTEKHGLKFPAIPKQEVAGQETLWQGRWQAWAQGVGPTAVEALAKLRQLTKT